MAISVIMSAYNRAEHVEEAVESVLGQSYRDFELIVIDDGSTDGTSEILDALSQRDERIRVVHQPVNKGLACGRNLALSLARHELVACMDDDDVMLPDRLAVQSAFMERNQDISALSSCIYFIDEAGRVIGKSISKVDVDRGRAERNPSFFLELIHPAAMYRKSHVLEIGGYREMLLEDRDLWGRMVTSGYRLAAQDDFVLKQRKHSSFMLRDVEKIFEYGDYIDFNVVRRLDGLEEISFEEYRRIIDSLPLGRRIDHKRRRHAGMAFRHATLHYSRRDWLPFAGRIATAVALDPRRSLAKLAEKAVVRKSR